MPETPTRIELLPFREVTVAVGITEAKDGPCPSCGAAAVYSGWLGFSHRHAGVRCPECGLFLCRRKDTDA